MYQIQFWLRLRPRVPAGGAYVAPPDLLAGLRGPTSKGRGGGREGTSRGGEPRGRDRTPSRPPNPYFWIRPCVLYLRQINDHLNLLFLAHLWSNFSLDLSLLSMIAKQFSHFLPITCQIDICTAKFLQKFTANDDSICRPFSKQAGIKIKETFCHDICTENSRRELALCWSPVDGVIGSCIYFVVSFCTF